MIIKYKSIRVLVRHLFRVFYRTKLTEFITEIEVLIVLGILKLDINKKTSNKFGQETVILSAPDGGNIGDRMMLLSVLNEIKHRCRIISESSQNLTLLTGSHEAPEILQIKNLYHRIPGFHLYSLIKFARYIRHSQSILLIGADLMDGKYNYIASLHRLQLLHLANKLRIQSKVLGFSWGEEFDNTLISYMKNHCGITEFCARDPISKLRLNNLGINNTIQTSDLVFRLSFIMPNLIANKKREIHPYCVINGSGLISNSTQSKNLYLATIKKLIKQDFHIYLVPHVIRNSDDDLIVLSSIYEEFRDLNQVVLIDQLLSPQEIFEYCEGASLVLTSRMHLAILSLLSGTPPITFASNGKVEGLLKMFELEGICISSGQESPEYLSRLIDNYFVEFKEMKSQIRNNLPHIIQLSSLQFN